LHRFFSSLARRSAFLFAAPLLLIAANAPALKQIAVLDLPGKPGFDEIALVHGMILVSHPGAGAVDLFDTQKRRIVGHIRDMWSPRGVAVDEAAHLVYIANAGARNIVVVSTADWQVKRTIPVDSAPDALFVLPGRHTLYVTFPESQSIAGIDLTAASGVASDAANDAARAPVVSRLALDGRPYAFAYDPSRQRLFLTLQDRRSVLVLSPTLELLATFSLNASEPAGIAFSPRFDRLYVAVRYAVLALDPGSGEELSRSAVAGGIDQLSLDDASGSLLGVSHGSVFVVPASASLGPASELDVEVKGHTLAYDSATGYLYLPGGREGRSKLLILKRVNGSKPGQ
jgi:DNA-binding beta-propeller fold protein YncE